MTISNLADVELAKAYLAAGISLRKTAKLVGMHRETVKAIRCGKWAPKRDAPLAPVSFAKVRQLATAALEARLARIRQARGIA